MLRSKTIKPRRAALVASLLLILIAATGAIKSSGLGDLTIKEMQVALVSIHPTGQCGRGSGTGFLFTPYGHILSAAHVVGGAEVGNEIPVQWAPTESSGGIRTFSAKVVDKSLAVEAVILQIPLEEGDRYPYLTLGNSDAVLDGEQIKLLGFPDPEHRGCIVVNTANGEVRARFPGPEIPSNTRESCRIPRYQADAFEISVDKIFPGSSGSPVIAKATNEVIGILFCGRLDVEFYWAVPINEVIHTFSKTWLETRGFFPSYVLGAQIEFSRKIIADGQPVPGKIEFWALRGNLRRVRLEVLKGEDLVLQPTDTRVRLDPEKPSYQRGDQLDMIVEPLVGDKREGVISFTIATETPQDGSQLRFSLIDAAGNRSAPQELTFSAVPPLHVITDFEGTECSERHGEHLIGFGSFYTRGRGIAIESCMRDPVDPNNRGNVVREEYDVDERHYPGVSHHDLYVGFWLHWKKEDFKPENYEKLCMWLRGGDKEVGLRYTARVKVELKIRGWGWRFTYLEGLTDQWKQFCIPLADFTPVSLIWPPPDNPGKPNEFVIVFENQEVTEKKGVIWIDEIGFVPIR